MATANCVHPHAQHEQPGAHCEQWHGHHKAHWRVQRAVLSTPRTVCRCTCVHTSHLWLKSRIVCHSISSMHAHLCLVPWVVSPHPSLYFFFQFLFQLYLMSIPAPDEISIEDPLCNSSLGSMVTLDYVTPLTDSDVAGSSKDTQRIQPKPKNQERWDLYVDISPHRNSRNVPSLITTFLVKRNMMKSQTRQVRGAVCGPESTNRCVLTLTHVEEDQTGTGRPVLVDQQEAHEIDFRAPGLSHAVVKEAEHLRVQELAKKIENHLHREAFHADMQQNNVNSPLSNNSKKMIPELGSVELFELCETTPKVQCSHCLLCWIQGIVYCICGHCLIDSESRRKLNKLRLDAFSFPNYVMKQGLHHGARHGKAEE